MNKKRTKNYVYYDPISFYLYFNNFVRMDDLDYQEEFYDEYKHSYIDEIYED